MTRKKTVCVYCGASPRVDKKFMNAAEETGKAIAQANCDIIYGGGTSGLMGIIANSGLANGANVTGIIPGHIDEREIMHPSLTELHVVTSMHERKAMMANRSDIFLILPGGLGTMDEFFEIVTWKQLGLHEKPIIIYNIEKYWDNLQYLVRHISNENFMKESDQELFSFCNKLDDVIKIIQTAPYSQNAKQNDIL